MKNFKPFNPDKAADLKAQDGPYELYVQNGMLYLVDKHFNVVRAMEAPRAAFVTATAMDMGFWDKMLATMKRSIQGGDNGP
jgi:hypothetical protein